MGKSPINRNATTEEEFASLEKVLNQTADDAARCLKLLKKNLSSYDSRHDNHFSNTAASYMRSDMRTAKDTADDLKRVAHQINDNSHHSEAEIASARSTMDNTAKAMDVLKMTARNYDLKNGRSKGILGAIDNALGNNDMELNEMEKGESDGTSDDKEKERVSTFDGLKHKGYHDGGVLVVDNDDSNNERGHDGGIFSADSVEEMVTSTLRDNFNLNALDRQIKIAEKAIMPSFFDRAKEAVNEVKEKITGDTTGPTHDAHHSNQHAVLS